MYCLCYNYSLRSEDIDDGTGLIWYYWKHNQYSMKQASMKIQPNGIEFPG